MFTYATPAEDCLKSQAQKLKAFLVAKGLDLNHTGCLEAIAAQYGHKSWHHAQAHCLAHAPSVGGPFMAAAAKADEVSSFLVDCLLLHADTFKSTVSQLVGGRVAPVIFSEANDVSNDPTEGRGVTVGATAQLDDETTLSMFVHLIYSNDFGTLNCDLNVHFEVKREGHGPEDVQGMRENALDWYALADAPDFAIGMDTLDWKKALRAELKELPLATLLKEVIEEAGGSFSELQAALAVPIPGFAAEDLMFGWPQEGAQA